MSAPELVERSGFDRRAALKKAAVAGGLVWATPAIASSRVSAASACTPACVPSGGITRIDITSANKINCRPQSNTYSISFVYVFEHNVNCPCSDSPTTFFATSVRTYSNPVLGTPIPVTLDPVSFTCTDESGNSFTISCTVTVDLTITNACAEPGGLEVRNERVSSCTAAVCDD